MGNCSGKGDDQLQEGEDGMQTGTFTVTNINDDHRLVHKGKMVVTATELIYIDNKTKQEWEWPFKYLRRYGCEGNVFSFEAGRKCANGEGTYAFICKKANILFNMVARNITQGGVQPDVDNNNGTVDEFPFPRPQTVSPRPQDPEPPPLPPFHPPSPLPPAPLPAPPPPEPDTETPQGPEDSPPPPPPIPPPESTKNYSDLVFTNESSEPVPSAAGDHAPYSKISFEETEKLSRGGGKKIPVNDLRLGGERRHTHGGSTSSNKKVRKHSKKSRSPSCSSNSSVIVEAGPKFPSVSESILEAGGERQTITESSYQNLLIGEELREEERRGSIDQPTYSNIDISTGEVLPPDQSVPLQPEYTNINIGPAPSSNGRIGAGEIVDQPNYENIKPGGVVASTPISTPTPRSDYLNYTVSGDMTTPPDQPNYTNITPGPDVATSLDAPNYLNITPGPNVSSSIEPARSHTYTHHSLDYRHRSTSNVIGGGGSATISGGGDSMQTYIELDISKSSQYAQLDIGGGGGESERSLRTRDRAMSSSVIHNQSDSSFHHHPQQQQQSDYTVLNFEAMAAIKSMREEIEEEVKEKEKEAKEKAHGNKKGVKKGK
ncbi:PREDICTED: proline-rich receptor-like protein kinase PERK7 [Amphimedon queenslandica]|uniref:IRS-type PTB domain-containing protein n=1 Tax=Amphimedon queenslandica TaxID=400682 RepID=A0A1X7VP94_AMPQE|nr:PREDICTED: proline-rich receptor-like protein kinase PERK7 [Amphimedon queenslandica]|eukprot:XP_003383468.1 PREDICTED: proline-rich receptor-like protein kinase PERK7 [Amphimedon queenslandica]